MNELGTTGRIFYILETLSKTKSMKLERISEATNIPKVTALRLLSSLTKTGYIIKNPDDTYSLTLKMFSVGSRALDWTDIIEKSRPIADKLRDELGETVHMGILEDSKAVYILKEESSQKVRMYSRVGVSIPLYCSGLGKCLLAYQNNDFIDEYIKNNKFIRYTTNTIVSPEKLKIELDEIRQKGYSIDDEENEAGIFCLSAPIFNHEKGIVAALSVSWPTFRIDKNNIHMKLSKILSSSLEISSILGYIKSPVNIC